MQEAGLVLEVHIPDSAVRKGVESRLAHLPQLVALTLVSCAHDVIGIIGQDGIFSEDRKRTSGEPVLLLSSLAALPKDLRAHGEFGAVEQFGNAVGEFQNIEGFARHRGDVQHAFVQEGGVRVRSVLGINNLRNLKVFRPQAGDIGGNKAHVVVHHISKGRLRLQVKPEAVMRERPILRHERCLSGGLDAGGPLVSEIRQETAFQAYILAGFRPQVRFYDVQREIIRFQEQGRAHFIARRLLERQRSGPGGILSVSDALHARAGRPLRQGAMDGLEPAFFKAAPDGGLALRHKAVRIDAEQADLLSPQQAGDQQAEGHSLL